MTLDYKRVVDVLYPYKGGKTKCVKWWMRVGCSESIVNKWVEGCWWLMWTGQNAKTKCYISFTFALHLKCVWTVFQRKNVTWQLKRLLLLYMNGSWWYMGVHQREGVIGAIGALERLIPCVYGLYGVFRVNWWHCQCEREERLSGACFYWYYDGFSAWWGFEKCV